MVGFDSTISKCLDGGLARASATWIGEASPPILVQHHVHRTKASGACDDLPAVQGRVPEVMLFV